MERPENYNSGLGNTPKTPETTVPTNDKEPSQAKPPEMSRRGFLAGMAKIGAAAAVASLGTVVSEEVQAGERKRRVPEINQREQEEAAALKFEQSKANIEYVGFRPNKHQAIIVRARLNQVVPDAVSAEIFLERPKGSSLVTMRISVIKNNGSLVETHARFNVSSRDVGKDADFTPALAHLFVRLEAEQEKNKK